MSGAVVCTEKTDGLTAVVIEDAGRFAVVARVGRREGEVARYDDKRHARALARSLTGCASVPGFRDWLASGDGWADAF